MKFVAIAMVLAAVGTCPTALAGESSVSIRNLSVTLQGFRTTPPVVTESASTAVWTQAIYSTPISRLSADGFLVPLHTELGVPPWWASATVSEGAGGPAIDVVASAPADGIAYRFTSATAASIADLIVPAYTSATISADFSVSGTASSDHEEAEICLELCSHRELFGPEAADFSLTWTFVNDYGGNYPALMFVYASAFALSIPEPGERLMMLAGLALICAGAMRRRPAPATSR